MESKPGLHREKRKRRQHLVPKTYLRGWADDRERILMVNRRNPNDRRLTHVSQAAVQSEFYTVEDPEGARRYDVEDALGKIESAAAPVLRQLRRESLFGLRLDPESRRTLALFMGIQKLRGRDFRHSYGLARDAFTKILAKWVTPESMRRTLEDIGETPTDEEVDEDLAWLQDPEAFRVEPHPNDAIKTMLQLGPALAVALFGFKTWNVARSRAKGVITSDSPMTLWSDNPSPFMGIGIMTADEVRFPIDRSTLLFMTPGSDPDTVMPTEKSLHDANRLTLYGSYEWVFAHPDDEAHVEALDGWGDPPPVITIQADAGVGLPESVTRPPYRRQR